MAYKKQLEDLRVKLGAKQMSILVGSGFSKNVSELFPSWNELLFDLVAQLYQDELDKAFNLKIKNAARKIDKAKFRKEKCTEILQRVGYLDVVSHYLRNRSVESIATYIEERTPYAELIGNELVLEIKGTLSKLPITILDLHRQLIELPWNNVYTTNYDQLLDLCIDETFYERISGEIDSLEIEINELWKEIVDMGKEIESIDNEIADLKSNRHADENNDGPVPSVVDNQETKLSDKKNSIYNKIHSLTTSKKIKEEQMRSRRKALIDCHTVVKDASGLSIKRNKNIIKLHGSLRTKRERENHHFTFDNDHKKQYVICREDYDSYPKKHEPFTQLMRISLLQEAFCIIGFSGDDSNFLAWVSWVRDVIQRKGNPIAYKIYLVETSHHPLSTDKELFYENHRIFRIPLMDPVVMDIIQNDTGLAYSSTQKKEAVKAFLTFLGNHSDVLTGIPAPIAQAKSELKELWKTFSPNLPDLVQMQNTMSNSVNRLKEVWSDRYIPIIWEVNTYYQQRLLSSLKIDSYQKHQKNIGVELASAIVMAVKDLQLPLGFALDKELISHILAFPELSAQVDPMIQRDRAMSLDLDMNGTSKFHQAIFLAFSFRFDELKVHLASWEPTPDNILLKAGLYCLFDSGESESLLREKLLNYQFFSPEMKLHTIELLSYIDVSQRFPRDEKLQRLIDGFEQKGYQSVRDTFKYLIENVEKKPEKPQQLGGDRFSIGRRQEIDDETSAGHSLQFLMLLINSGFQLRINHTQGFSTETWYLIISKGFEYYPHAFIFYALQITDAEYLKRLGQDYAFNSRIAQHTNEKIVKNLMKGMSSVNYNYRRNGMVFLSKLLIAIDPLVWQDDFMELWRASVDTKNAFEERHLNDLAPLADFGFEYITNKEYIFEILADNLDELLLDRNKRAGDYLYHLRKNYLFSSLKPSGHLTSIPNSLDELIKRLDEKNFSDLFVLGYLDGLLTKVQKIKLGEQIALLDYSKITDSRIWNPILHFIHHLPGTVQKVKEGILASGQLWDSGIEVKENGRRTIHGGVRPIMLSSITKTPYNSSGITWSDKEIRVIYQSMQAGLSLLKNERDHYDPIFGFEELIEEQSWFMEFYRDKLIDEESFGTVSEMVEQLHRKTVNYKDIEDGLTSNEHDQVVWALSEVSGLYYKKEIREDLLSIVVNKILLQSDPALEACISYLSSWLDARENDEGFYGLESIIVKLLTKYFKDRRCCPDIAYTEEKLIKIVYKMNDMGYKDEGIKQWLEYSRATRYNNVKKIVLQYDRKQLSKV